MMRPEQLFFFTILACCGVGGGCGPQVVTFTSTTASNQMTVEPTPTSTSTSATTSSTVSASSSGLATVGSSSTASTGDTTGETATATSSPLYKQDVGSVHDLGQGQDTPAGCQGKIDFIFVMSADGLLVDLQPQLVAAFPKFVETISTKFENFDVHIMVVDGAGIWGLEFCNGACPNLLTCLSGDPCCPDNSKPKDSLCCDLPEYPCDQLDLLTACDWTLGAGTVFPAGELSANKPCKIDGGRRYLTQDQTNLSETFSCIAQVGMTGGEMVVAALINAISPKFNAPGGCNEGFLRDDALLMVTMLGAGETDAGFPEDWYEAVVTAKNGNPEAVVMLILGNPACPDYDAPCNLAKMFPYWHVADLDANDLSPGFDAATDLIETACESLIPQ